MALAILAAVVLLVGFGVVAPIVRGFGDRAEAKAEARAELARDARLMAQRPALERELRARRAAGSPLIDAPDAARAGEAARGRVVRAAADAGAGVQGVRLDPPSAGEVRLHADLRCTLAQLTDMLRRLESAEPIASVSALTVSAPGSEAAAAGSSLEVRLDVAYGYAAAR